MFSAYSCLIGILQIRTAQWGLHNKTVHHRNRNNRHHKAHAGKVLRLKDHQSARHTKDDSEQSFLRILYSWKACLGDYSVQKRRPQISTTTFSCIIHKESWKRDVRSWEVKWCPRVFVYVAWQLHTGIIRLLERGAIRIWERDLCPKAVSRQTRKLNHLWIVQVKKSKGRRLPEFESRKLIFPSNIE